MYKCLICNGGYRFSLPHATRFHGQVTRYQPMSLVACDLLMDSVHGCRIQHGPNPPTHQCVITETLMEYFYSDFPVTGGYRFHGERSNNWDAGPGTV